ncbi:hypothetical protein MHBO_003134 [Bonamia ostreae]|uniref:non-specific serine/threonine protein kinase n=1 Tax=Bonamia ostreae TaxID=126728 RepID=A0ABV2APK8_9EUKA
MQYYPNGSLGKFAKSSFKNEIFYKPIFAQIINGLEALHKKRFAHLDIKPGNILIDSNFRIGLTDFGLSEIVEDVKELQIKGSPMFMAPEILKGRISLEADLWSLGVTMYMCITGSRPFDFKNAFVNKKLDLRAVYSAITSDIKYPPMSEQCEDLMRKLMKTSKEERLGAGKDGFEKLKRHPFFNGIDWNTPFESNPTLTPTTKALLLY